MQLSSCVAAWKEQSGQQVVLILQGGKKCTAASHVTRCLVLCISVDQSFNGPQAVVCCSRSAVSCPAKHAALGVHSDSDSVACHLPDCAAGCVVSGCDAGSLFAACFDAAAAPLQGVTSTARVGEQAAGAAVKALASAPVAGLPGAQTSVSKKHVHRACFPGQPDCSSSAAGIQTTASTKHVHGTASLGSQTAALLQLQRMSSCALCLLVLKYRQPLRASGF